MGPISKVAIAGAGLAGGYGGYRVGQDVFTDYDGEIRGHDLVAPIAVATGAVTMSGFIPIMSADGMQPGAAKTRMATLGAMMLVGGLSACLGMFAATD